jgi:hypothetical protein
MTRFAWLQTRTQTLTALGAALVVAVVAAITGISFSRLYADLVTGCQAHGSCDLATSQFLEHQRFLQTALPLLVVIVPALIGVFWGAPLVARELESGTYRLAWTQSVTRSRWVLTKLGVGALASAGLAGLVTLTVTWWFRAVDLANKNQYDVFDSRNIAPVAHAVFAFALGAFVGVLVRRVVPAMATTLVVFVAVRIATALWVRPRLLPPVAHTVALQTGDRVGFLVDGSSVTLVAGGSAPANAWLLSSQIVDASGHAQSSGQLTAWIQQHCPVVASVPRPGSGGGLTVAAQGAFQSCQQLAGRTFRLLVTYQPASHYWGIQAIEAALFTVLAAGAAAGCYVWTTRRTS